MKEGNNKTHFWVKQRQENDLNSETFLVCCLASTPAGSILQEPSLYTAGKNIFAELYERGILMEKCFKSV